MKHSLIITGVGYFDYATAGAIARRSMGDDARIIGVSKSKFPEKLLEYGTGKTRICVLGVSLEANVARLKEVLAELGKRGTRTEWISVLEPEPSTKKVLERLMDIRVMDFGTLEEAAREYFKSSLSPSIESDRGQYEELVEAALFMQRTYDKERIYGEVVELMAQGIPSKAWDKRFLDAVAHYRRYGGRELVGRSEAIRNLREKIKLIAAHPDAWVMILGESGTGKETVAQLIHNLSPRGKAKFVAFNCATIAKDLLESRFFGYEKGAFTGADSRKEGLFKEADGGTLFLDEIGELPPEVQGLLLRVLEGGRFQRVGGTEEVSVDVRLITATNRNLPKMVREGKFRADLYQRLNVVPIKIPALRDHKEDIGAIADGWWFGRHCTHLDDEQVAALEDYSYPGNVRELFNLLERASVTGETDFRALLAEQKAINAELLDEEPTPANLELPDNLEEAKRIHIKSVYLKYDGNLVKTAEALGVARNTVGKYLK